MTDSASDDVARIAAGLTAGVRRAILGMTSDWRRASKATFNATGAHCAVWYQPELVEREQRGHGRYRLRPLGIRVRAHLEASQ